MPLFLRNSFFGSIYMPPRSAKGEAALISKIIPRLLSFSRIPDNGICVSIDI
jgi:hypothetical protein